MKIAYFDTFSGASGDMIVGSLLDAGLSLDDLRAELGRLGLDGYTIEVGRTRRGALDCAKFHVHVEHAGHGDGPGHGHHHHHHHHHEHRTLGDIVGMIDASSLADGVKDRAQRVFRRLAEAEGAVHGEPVDRIHFHEVGAVDSIVDIVGAAVGLERLGVERVASGPLRFGSGFVECQHGTIPLPAPATVRLAEGFPVEHTEIEGELTTPTGAAILTALAESFGPAPPMTLDASGLGAGSADRAERPNALRVLLGETEDAASDRVVVLEANIDDATPEVIGYASGALLDAGALDVFAVPIQMKKSRPAALLSVIARPELRSKLEAILFRETTTFGVRRREELRTTLARRTVEIDVPGGTVRVKLGMLAGEVVTAAPEYEDCARLARERGVPLRRVYDAARQAAAREATP
jgi:hypothetical protein